MAASKNLVWNIGDVRITRIVETVAAIPPDGLLPGSAAAVAAHESWLKPHFVDAEGNLLLSIHGLVVESQGKSIVVDTCIGEHVVPGFEELGSQQSGFLRDLEEAGFPRDQVDVVLCTHLHFDHVGWNTMRDGERWVPTFPNARYLFARLEYEHWQGESERPYASTYADAVTPIVEAGLCDLVETDHRITDEVWLEATPGHTPGHVAVHIESRGVEALITGDLTHHPIQWAEPDLGMPADSDSSEAAATRKRLLAEHADSALLVIGTHYAEPCSGRIVRDEGGGHRFHAAPR
jgi:glyoxylase-like metal-dependent hydrolase (beta-lactamase superfamily II)